jgi:hypothetical protein
MAPIFYVELLNINPLHHHNPTSHLKKLQHSRLTKCPGSCVCLKASSGPNPSTVTPPSIRGDQQQQCCRAGSRDAPVPARRRHMAQRIGQARRRLWQWLLTVMATPLLLVVMVTPTMGQASATATSSATFFSALTNSNVSLIQIPQDNFQLVPADWWVVWCGGEHNGPLWAGPRDGTNRNNQPLPGGWAAVCPNPVCTCVRECSQLLRAHSSVETHTPSH